MNVFARILVVTLLFCSLTEAKSIHELEPLAYDKQQAETAIDIVKKLETEHYTSRRFTDLTSSKLLDNYLKRLDGNKSVLLQSDIKEFEQYRHRFDDDLKKGDLNAGFVIFNRYQQRVTSRVQIILDTLDDSVAAMDFTRDETLLIDRSEASWPKDAAEADEIWRQLVKSRVLSLRLAGKSNEEILPLLKKRYTNQLNRLKQSNNEDAFQLFMNALTELYDPHTNYMSPSTSENFKINMSLSLEGIGAVLQTEDEYTKVVRLIHAGPADKQGELQPSDRIIGVAQGVDGGFEDVVGVRLDEVVQLIRGPKGSTVQLEVIPVSANTNDEHKVISIVRNTVKLEDQSAKKSIIELPQDDRLIKIGVIDIPTFYHDFDAQRRGDPNYRSTTRDVKKLLDELIAEGVEGIIIDVRDNGGGSLPEVNGLTGLFIDSGPTVQIRHSSSQVRRQGKRRSSVYYDGPLAVMINRLSASASEIFAGAIQDYQRGLIIGSQTFGKGTVQTLSKLDQGRLKITQAKFYRISGGSTQHRGVLPDIEFPSMYDQEKVGESSLKNALLWDRISAAPHDQYFITSEMLPELRKRHQQRIKNDPDFIFLNEQLAILNENRQLKSVSLNEQQRKANTEQNKARALAIENKRRKAKGLELLDEVGSDNSDDNDTQTAEEKTDEPDPLLLEAGNILIDAMPIYLQQRFAVSNAS